MNFTATSSKLADQFRLFYAPDHPHRLLVERFSEVHRELSESIPAQLQEVFNAGILRIPTEYLRECESVENTMKARDDALRSVEKLQRKHDTNAEKSAKEEKVMYTGEMLKEAYNSYALLHERAVEGATKCHDKIVDVVDPAFMGLLYLQSELYTAAYQQVTKVSDLHLTRGESLTIAPSVLEKSHSISGLSTESRHSTSLHSSEKKGGQRKPDVETDDGHFLPDGSFALLSNEIVGTMTEFL